MLEAIVGVRFENLDRGRLWQAYAVAGGGGIILVGALLESSMAYWQKWVSRTSDVNG